MKEGLSIKNKMSKRLKKLRTQSGLTQAQLAKRLNISPSSIGMYEQGRREPKNSVLVRICKELNTSGDYILDINNEAKENTLSFDDVNSIVTEFVEFMKTKKYIMINGVPVDKINKEKIATALKVAIAVALSDSE